MNEKLKEESQDKLFWRVLGKWLLVQRFDCEFLTSSLTHLENIDNPGGNGIGKNVWNQEF